MVVNFWSWVCQLVAKLIHLVSDTVPPSRLSLSFNSEDVDHSRRGPRFPLIDREIVQSNMFTPHQQWVLRDLEDGLPVIIHGRASTGKTFVAQWIGENIPGAMYTIGITGLDHFTSVQIKEASIIAIDGLSTARELMDVDFILRERTGDRKPFGGKRCVLVGDIPECEMMDIAHLFTTYATFFRYPLTPQIIADWKKLSHNS